LPAPGGAIISTRILTSLPHHLARHLGNSQFIAIAPEMPIITTAPTCQACSLPRSFSERSP